MPAELDVVMSMAIMDAQRIEEKKRNKMTEADFYTVKDQRKELLRLQIRHNMEIDSTHLNSDR